MLDLFDEFAALVAGLDAAGIPYAVCGGLAMAVHGFPRATVDVDLLIPPDALDDALAVAARLGYDFPSAPMSFADGRVEVRRVNKTDTSSGDVLSLDVLLVTPALDETWRSRHAVTWARGTLWVVSREGLIAMKQLRNSGQDQDDIRRLRGDLP